MARQTRAARAGKLLAVLETGPSMRGVRTMTPEVAERQVRLWLQTWIIPEVLELVPELRAAELARERAERGEVSRG